MAHACAENQVLSEEKHFKFVNKILDEIDKHSDLASISDSEDSFFALDYTQPPHDISDSDICCVDEGHIQTLTRVLIAKGLGGVSTDFVWQNMDTFNLIRETFCDISGPQFDVSGDIVAIFEEIFDHTLLNIIVEETNKYALQSISKSTFREQRICITKVRLEI